MKKTLLTVSLLLTALYTLIFGASIALQDMFKPIFTRGDEFVFIFPTVQVAGACIIICAVVVCNLLMQRSGDDGETTEVEMGVLIFAVSLTVLEPIVSALSGFYQNKYYLMMGSDVLINYSIVSSMLSMPGPLLDCAVLLTAIYAGISLGRKSVGKREKL